MIINKVKLHNIRSYVDCDVAFNEGDTLLAGDIGSGKSSILLAIDFALFGITKSLNGDALLRNGADSGYVELDFSIADKNARVRRSLVKNKNGISQEEGYIQINGKLERCTAMELKQRVLEMLNYPKDLVTKSKNLVYRYTVYTPQEEMKKILQEENEIRIDTLRKIFGIDKYKRIKENVDLFSGNLRDDIKSLSSMTADADIKKKEFEEYTTNDTRLKKEIDLMKPRIEETKGIVELKRKALEINEMKAKGLAKLKNEFEVNKVRISYLNNEINSAGKELEEIDSRMASYGDIKDADNKNIEGAIKQEKERLNGMENIYRDALNQASVVKAGMQNSSELIEKISSMDLCPVCKQNVGEKHKHDMETGEKSKIGEMNRMLDSITLKASAAKEDIEKSKAMIELLNEERQKIEINKLKLRNLNELKSKKDYLMKKHVETLATIKNAEEIAGKLSISIANLGDADRFYLECKNEVDKYYIILRELEIKHSAINTRYMDNKNIIIMLDNEIKRKEAIKNRVQNMEKIRQWLDEVFVEMANIMEKRIMSKIYNDFNSLFRKWFNVIMGDEGLTVMLDPEFNTSIEQNGYNVDYSNLSGGEKTAVALAYRLALNQVINNLVVNIKTNDLIILDEPTDGFSDDQIGRIKYVLDELDIKQTIIVSHEPKIESFVSNIIRIKKENHVSCVC